MNDELRSLTYGEFQKKFFTHLRFYSEITDISPEVETYLDLETMRYVYKYIL